MNNATVSRALGRQARYCRRGKESNPCPGLARLTAFLSFSQVSEKTALPLWPSLLWWLHGKQTCLKGKSCSLSLNQKKKKEEGRTDSFPFLLAIWLPIMQKGLLFDPVPVFPCNKASYYWETELITQRRHDSVLWITTGCNHLTLNSRQMSQW